VQITADEVLDGSAALNALSAAVKAGATGVVLSEAAPGAGSSRLYDAAVKLKELLSGRAALLVADRLDIAQAAEANGVLLSDTGTCAQQRPLHTHAFPTPAQPCQSLAFYSG
jgi:thiamine monophosphate synthase